MSLALLLWSTTTVHSSLLTAMSFISCFTLHATSMFPCIRINTTIDMLLDEVILLVFSLVEPYEYLKKDQSEGPDDMTNWDLPSIDELRQLVVIVRTGNQLFTVFFSLLLTLLFKTHSRTAPIWYISCQRAPSKNFQGCSMSKA
jgi:hypothetical protein